MSAPRLPTRFDPEVSHLLEALAARAWPADETELVEGWLLRRTEGVARRRSNSLLPPADPGQAARTVDMALASAEDLDFAAVVQVSPAEGHLRLDAALEGRGMPRGGASLVLAGAAGHRVGRVDDVSVALSGLTPAWVEAWAAVSGGTGTAQTAALVLAQLGDRAAFAIARDEATGAPLGVAIGVEEQGWLGLFSLGVLPSARRRGVASVIVAALECWARSRGASSVYLQVEQDNHGALAFYARRGFHIAHSYHYRSQQ
jgi:GNAT superfamily N-acetyltransferase